MRIVKLIPVFLLCVLLASPSAFAVDGNVVSPSMVSNIEADSGGVVQPETVEPVPYPLPEVATELDYLISINAYLTYLFGFGVCAVVLACFVLVYKFFIMFF